MSTVSSYVDRIEYVDNVVTRATKCMLEKNPEVSTPEDVVINADLLAELMTIANNYRQTILDVKVEEVE